GAVRQLLPRREPGRPEQRTPALARLLTHRVRQRTGSGLHLMRISVIGVGYLGAVHAAAMADLGHTVVGVDVDEAKIAALSEARAPFFEPGLPDVLASATASGRLRFTTDFAAVAD